MAALEFKVLRAEEEAHLIEKTARSCARPSTGPIPTRITPRAAPRADLASGFWIVRPRPRTQWDEVGALVLKGAVTLDSKFPALGSPPPRRRYLSREGIMWGRGRPLRR